MSLFISFEGPEGSGKTTQAKRLKEALEDRNDEVLLTREPGGTPIGDAVREILLNPDYDDMTALTELFLYEASRSQHVSEVIEPALENGKIVLSDRFADASLIYQGIARQVGEDTVESLNDLATRSLTPDLTVILDVQPEDGLDRARETSDNYTKEGDRIEQESSKFHRRVRDGYRQLAEREPDRCILLSRDRSIDSIHDEILSHVEALLDE
jgi:dTMP kinase